MPTIFNDKGNMPGVYLFEEDVPGPIAGVGTSTAAFIGPASKGNLNEPTCLTNWTQFKEKFGESKDGKIRYSSYAVRGFFENGGTKCYFVRIGDGKGECAKCEVKTEDKSTLLFSAKVKEEGCYGNNYSLKIDAITNDRENFNFTLMKKQIGSEEEGVIESFGKCSLDMNKPNCLFKKNSPNIEFDDFENASQALLSSDKSYDFINGKDFNFNGEDFTNGIAELKVFDDINIICAPDAVQLGVTFDSAKSCEETSTGTNTGTSTGTSTGTNLDNKQILDVHMAMISHCEEMQDRFAIIDPPMDKDYEAIIEYRKPLNSKNGYAALYYPYVEVMDLAGKNTIKVPPSGIVAGLYARSDNQYGVHQAPAGEFLPLKRVVRVEKQFDAATNGRLNEAGVNVIRFISGVGPVIWGARTLAKSGTTQWRYINVRRFMLYVEESVMEAANALVFKPNNKALWQTVKRQIKGFLTGEWQRGALVGETPDKAFVIKVDEENNPSEALAKGILYIDVGLYPTTPAEFIVFRVTQNPGGPPTIEEK